VFEVIDRGIGIDEGDLVQIFDDFVQLGSGKEEGTGLGLAISRRLADLLGARLEVESEIGVGSTFRVILPVVGEGRTEAE
jgi:signal transduction histidine kinase